MYDSIYQWLTLFQLDDTITKALSAVSVILLLMLLARVCHFFCKRGLFRSIHYMLSYRSKVWDEILNQTNFFGRASHIPTALVMIVGLSNNLLSYPQLSFYIEQGLWIYLYLGSLLTFFALIDTFGLFFNTRPSSSTLPITSVSQLLKLIISILVLILIASDLTKQSPLYLLSGLGAVTAIIILAFRDTILGFVASVQVTSNDMVRKHDWIEMPQFGADGEVLEVGLNTVKVQNWDKTVTTIPTYALMNDAFKNWRHMSFSGGRRVKRSLSFDINSIGFASQEQINHWQDIAILDDYLTTKKTELDAAISAANSKPHPANKRQLTNIGTFRAYCLAYLAQHPKVNDQMTLIVRQRPTSEKGQPLECYFFISDTRWKHYENIQSDIFDHLIAIAPEFGLRLYQAPTGADFSKLGSH